MGKIELTSFTTEDKQIIPCINNKQCYLGVLIRRLDNSTINPKYEILKNVIVYGKSVFSTTRDALSGEIYNFFPMSINSRKETIIETKKFNLVDTHSILGIDPQIGVVPYSIVYKDRILADNKRFIDNNNLQADPYAINYAATLLEFQEMARIISSFEKSNNGESRVLK